MATRGHKETQRVGTPRRGVRPVVLAVLKAARTRRRRVPTLMALLCLLAGSVGASTSYTDSSQFVLDTRDAGGTGYGDSASFALDTRGNEGLSDRATSGFFVLDTRSGQPAAATYALTASASYSSGAGTVRVIAYAYDLQTGASVSTGTGSYQIKLGGATVGSGALTYSSVTRVWDSGPVSFAGAGTYSVVVTINGQTKTTSFVVGAGGAVGLVGTVTNDDGNPLNGATVKLYAASAVLGAANLNNLPAPLATTTTTAGGAFDFGSRPVGQYVLVIESANGRTIGPVFWLKNGVTTHAETVVENPGRTILLHRRLALKNVIQTQLVDKQTQWMHDVAYTVDEDLDATPDLLDWAIMVANIAAGTGKAIQQASKVGLTTAKMGQIAARVTGEELLSEGLTLAGTVTAVDLASMGSQMIIAKGALAQPYFAYGTGASAELTAIDSVLRDDLAELLDPVMHSPFLAPTFTRSSPVHRHPLSWFTGLGSYQFAQTWLQTYYAAGLTDFPTLPQQFDVRRAQALLLAAESQLFGLGSGAGQLYVSPNPSEWTSTSAPFEPLGLNLYDYKMKYETGQSKAELLDWVSKGSGIASAYFTGAAAASAAGIVTAPGAAIGATAAAVSQGISIGASVYQATIKAEMVATYVQMSAKYSANLLTSPLVLKRTDDFLISEATNPYYLNAANQFDGAIGAIDLGGTTIAGREVFFPVQLKLLPFMPPIQLTGVKNATVPFSVPNGGLSPAVYRIESKVTDFSGVHDHVVIRAGQFAAGQNGQVQQPFKGHMQPNAIFSAGRFESRLWVGPFQKAIKTKDFLVMPINVGISPLPFAVETVEAEMRKPLDFVKMEQQSLSGDDIVALADRVRERVETNLVVGVNIVEKTYTFGNDVFEAEFRLYRPGGAQVRFSAWENGEYVGWDSVLNAPHLGFPGAYSGIEANPEWITVPNCAGRTVTVRVELDEVSTEPVNVLLEVWEKPVRNAVLVVLPESVNIAVQPGKTHRIELGVGESSQQQPLQAVSVTLTPLGTGVGATLPWGTGWTTPTNLLAGSLRICEVDLDALTAGEGNYTGTVAVAASNVGTVAVPISVTVDGTPPTVNLTPVREWWYAATGPVLNWTGQDNVTASSNLLYSINLEGGGTGWSGFATNAVLDLTGVPDGTYTVAVIAKDQALNETTPPAAVVIHIDRAGNLWKQRIVGADPNDDITDVAQVAWDDDFDGDGKSNYEEYLAGTDPTNSSDRFAITGTTKLAAGFRILWHAKRGVRYQVLRTLDLKNGPWNPAPSGTVSNEQSQQQAGSDGVLEYVDTNPPVAAGFYKIRIIE